MIGDHDFGRPLVFVEAHFLDSRRAQSLSDEALGVVAPFDDVDLLAPQLVDDLPDARSAGPDARTHRVDVGVV